MKSLHKLSPEKVWLLLVSVTLASWYLTDTIDAKGVAATAAIVIAGFKINLVISHFMELDWQPLPWRRVLSIWIAIVLTIIIGGYWLGAL